MQLHRLTCSFCIQQQWSVGSFIKETSDFWHQSR